MGISPVTGFANSSAVIDTSRSFMTSDEQLGDFERVREGALSAPSGGEIGVRGQEDAYDVPGCRGVLGFRRRCFMFPAAVREYRARQGPSRR